MQFGSALWAALGIGLLIFIHELGHFLAARMAGVRVHVFSLGFGPRLCGLRWGDTDFRLSLVPFGGYVMVAGQDPSDQRFADAESLHSKSLGQRAWFWSGGVLMNLLFALLVFPLVFHAGVKMTAPVAGKVEHGSAAWEAGIVAGERIVAMQGRPIRSLESLSTEVALHGPRPLQLEVEAVDGSRRLVVATPRFSARDHLSELGLRAAVQRVRLEPKPGGAAATAGVQDGDELLAWNGIAVADGAALLGINALEQQLGELSAAPVQLRVRRDGAELELTVQPRLQPGPLRLGVQRLGRTIEGLRTDSALVEALELRRGDVLLAIDGEPYTGQPPASEAGRQQLELQLRRDGKVITRVAPATAAAAAALFDHLAFGFDDEILLRPTPGSPGALAGIAAGDQLLALDGEPVLDFSQLVSKVQQAAATPLRLRLRAAAVGGAGAERELLVQPSAAELHDLQLDLLYERLEQEIRAESLLQALQLGIGNSLELVKQFLVTLKRLATGDVGAKNLGGIVRISQFSYQAAERGSSWFWYFLALLSVNLAFVNLLPIPVLDGGHLLFLLIERIKGSPVSTRVLGYSQVIGLVFVLMLVLFVTYNDILRLL